MKILYKEYNIFKPTSFDHVAIDSNVTACDISKVPLKNDVLDAVVFSLSLMGANYKDYIKEAHRTLMVYGKLFIAEPASKWESKHDEMRKMLKGIGFKGIDITTSACGSFVYVECEKI